jgi:hypothetical protein
MPATSLARRVTDRTRTAGDREWQSGQSMIQGNPAQVRVQDSHVTPASPLFVTWRAAARHRLALRKAGIDDLEVLRWAAGRTAKRRPGQYPWAAAQRLGRCDINVVRCHGGRVSEDLEPR